MSNPTPTPVRGFTPRLYWSFLGRTGRLLMALIVLIVCEPVITHGGRWSLLTAGVWNAVLVTSLFAASRRRASHRLGLALTLLDYIILPLAAYGLAPVLIHVHSFLAFVILVYAAVCLLGDVLQSPRVTGGSIMAAVCVYIILGIIFMHLFLLIDYAQPGSFRLPEGMSDPNSGYRVRRHQTMELMYFSFVTLSTVGYGDITPVRGVARMFAALEAVTGQIYLAVLIARLVGLHIAQALLGPTASPDQDASFPSG